MKSKQRPEQRVDTTYGTGQVRAERESRTARDRVAVALAILKSWGGHNGEAEMMRVRRLLRKALEVLP